MTSQVNMNFQHQPVEYQQYEYISNNFISPQNMSNNVSVFGGQFSMTHQQISSQPVSISSQQMPVSQQQVF